jgi:hypothetical protein
MRFVPTNLRIVYLKNYLRKLKYAYLNSWVRQEGPTSNIQRTN